MKRTATIITLLAIIGSVALGIIIGQLSGGSDGETLPTSDVSEERRGWPSPTASLTAMRPAATPENMAVASPATAQLPIATPVAAGTPARADTPDSAATPVRPTPTVTATARATSTVTATARATSTAVRAPSESPSLGEIRQAPTMTPTLVPNPLPPATVTPTPSPPPTVAPAAAPSADDETSIVIRVP